VISALRSTLKSSHTPKYAAVSRVFASLEIPLFIRVSRAEDIQASENLGVQTFYPRLS
jgi:hypothetical protein